MEMDGGSNFHIYTKGACFLCLKVPATQTQNDAYCEGSKKYSFRQLSRYLNLDFLKIFNISMSLHAFTNRVLENAEMTVNICVGCEDAANKFSAFYDELERIQDELNQCVRQVHDIMVNADRNPNVVQRYRQRTLSGSPAQLIEANLAEKMREQTIEKCFRKFVGLGSNLVAKGDRNDKNNSQVTQTRPLPFQASSSSTKGKPSLHNQCGFQANTPNSSRQKPVVQMKKDPDEDIINLSSDEEFEPRHPAIQIQSLVDRNGQIYSASGENLTQMQSQPYCNKSSISGLDSAADATINEFLFPTLPAGSTSLNRPFSSSFFSKPKVEFKCDICEKITHSRHALELHKRQRHTGERPYHCIHCDGKFVSQGSLKIHIVREHRELLFSQFKEPRTSEQDFKAAVHQLFENYKRSDDRTRPYLCVYCDIQGYLHKRDLQAHMFQHHFDLLASKLQNFQRESNQRWIPQLPQQQFRTSTSSWTGMNMIREPSDNGAVKRMRHEYW